jgi:hypothetical protein
LKVYSFRLTSLGKLGAALFVLPTPIAAWKLQSVASTFAARSDFDRRLENLSGTVAVPDFPMVFLTALATASLVGLVLLLVGREIVTHD